MHAYLCGGPVVPGDNVLNVHASLGPVLVLAAACDLVEERGVESSKQLAAPQQRSRILRPKPEYLHQIQHKVHLCMASDRILLRAPAAAKRRYPRSYSRATTSDTGDRRVSS